LDSYLSRDPNEDRKQELLQTKVHALDSELDDYNAQKATSAEVEQKPE
jgi:hypothetical protein